MFTLCTVATIISHFEVNAIFTYCEALHTVTISFHHLHETKQENGRRTAKMATKLSNFVRKVCFRNPAKNKQEKHCKYGYAIHNTTQFATYNSSKNMAIKHIESTLLDMAYASNMSTDRRNSAGQNPRVAQLGLRCK